jgi:putrescine:ornithine antiporter
MALSALPAMMAAARVRGPRYSFTVAIALVGMLYGLYAIYAAGARAVFGGMLVMGVGFVMWGLLAPRAARRSSHTPLGATSGALGEGDRARWRSPSDALPE